MNAINPSQKQVQALYQVLRRDADQSGYGWAIGDDKLMAMADEGAAAVVNAKQEQSK